MNDKERTIRQRLKDDFEHYATKCLRIRTKEGAIKPFELNSAQKYIHKKIEEQLEKTGKVRAIILKGRQQGCSTYVEGRFYHKTTHRRGVRSFILTHEQEATNTLFEMAVRYHEHCPKLVRPNTGKANEKALYFNLLDSGYKVGTAGTKGVGRSSTIQYFHGSEVAYWPNADEHAKGVMQAIPDIAGTESILESTANGLNNYFSQQWQLAESGQSDYIPIFVPWFWQEEYTKRASAALNLTDSEHQLVELFNLTDGQISWRRSKVVELSANGRDGEKAFKQEYPCTPTEAFQTSGEDGYIKPDLVLTARKAKAEKYGPLVLGVDPARFGDDRSSIIRRCGRVAYGLESYSKKDTMEVTGIVHNIIKEEHPAKVFVDVGGLGAGVVDRLRELGYANIVVAVNSGERPLDANKYLNKRAEMWGEMRLWLEDNPSVIPDADSLQGDLCGLTYKFDSKTRLVMERKEDAKKRGVRSPDEADALALTFAQPVMPPPAYQEPVHVSQGWMG